MKTTCFGLRVDPLSLHTLDARELFLLRMERRTCINASAFMSYEEEYVEEEASVSDLIAAGLIFCIGEISRESQVVDRDVVQLCLEPHE